MPKQVELYVPLAYNDGTIIDPNTLRDEENFLSERFGGVSIIPNVRGRWYRDGAIQRECIEIWRIIVDEYDPSWWSGYKVRARNMYEQEDFLIVVSDVGLIL